MFDYVAHTAGVDYCWEDFNATCADDEVVLMTSALYGRMKIGRCLTRDYYVGCRSDVIRVCLHGSTSRSRMVISK